MVAVFAVVAAAVAASVAAATVVPAVLWPQKVKSKSNKSSPST